MKIKELKIKDVFITKPKDTILDIFREFGLLGVITYIGGILLLYYFPKQEEFSEQALYAVSGMCLLSLATLIYNFRIKAQREREKSLIEMVQATCNRLAEQIGKKMPDKQVFGVIQKIRQVQRDLIGEIYKHSIDK